MRQDGFIKNIVMIAIVLAVVFLSQKSVQNPFVSQITLKAQEDAKTYSHQASDWVLAKILPHANQEVQSRGESVQKAVVAEKNNLVNNLWDNVKNYSAQKFSQIFGTKVECKN